MPKYETEGVWKIFSILIWCKKKCWLLFRECKNFPEFEDLQPTPVLGIRNGGPFSLSFEGYFMYVMSVNVCVVGEVKISLFHFSISTDGINTTLFVHQYPRMFKEIQDYFQNDALLTS